MNTRTKRLYAAPHYRGTGGGGESERDRKTLIADIRQTVEEAVENAFARRDCKPPEASQ